MVRVVLHHDSIVDDLEAYNTSDLCRRRVAYEDSNAGLPSLWVRLKVDEELEGLLLERWVGLGLPCYRDGIFYL